MRAAAQFDGIAARLQHPNDIAVLVAEEGDRAELLGGLHRGLEMATGTVVEHLGIDAILDLGDLFRGEALVVAEVEAKSVGTDIGTLLLHVLAQHLTQRVVKDVGGGVVAPDRRTSVVVDGGGDDLARLEAAGAGDLVDMDSRYAIPGVGDIDGDAATGDRARVADLAAGLRVERGAVKHEGVVVDIQDGGLGGGLVAAGEVGLAVLVDECCEVTGIAGGCDLASLLGEALLFGHRGSEAVFVDLDTAFAGDLLGDLEWETVGVVQQEGDVAGECRTVGKSVELFVEDRLPLAKGLAEANFFAIDDLAHELVVGGEIRVVGAHDLDHGINHAAHDRRLDPEDVCMAHGATENAAQHIAPCLVRREHAVADEQ